MINSRASRFCWSECWEKMKSCVVSPLKEGAGGKADAETLPVLKTQGAGPDPAGAPTGMPSPWESLSCPGAVDRPRVSKGKKPHSGVIFVPR